MLCSALVRLDDDQEMPAPKRRNSPAQQQVKSPSMELNTTVIDQPAVSFIEKVGNIPSLNVPATSTNMNALPLHSSAQALTSQQETASQNINNNKQWSTWLAQNVNMNPNPRQQTLPVATRDVVITEELENKVHDILHNTSTRHTNNNKKGSFAI